MSVATSSNLWLSNCLCDLMASPHVTVPPHGGMPLGPGPMDVFSTRFDQYFKQDARGTLCGRPVDRRGLKSGLLALQKRWNPEAIKVLNEPGVHGFPFGQSMLTAEVEWTPRGSAVPEVVMAEASIGEEGGHEQIRFLKMEGNSALFRV
ncbi:hypothetical protein BV20DRAFT_972908 [Pilatotrama ljubarskyi]|nr:hypothetical protein BV20DRAFT_972908 [Pilatotrama ljubarskyi]